MMTAKQIVFYHHFWTHKVTFAYKCLYHIRTVQALLWVPTGSPHLSDFSLSFLFVGIISDVASTAAWGAWGNWEPCTKTCGAKGVEIRHRNCTGVGPCKGRSQDERICDNSATPCPGDNDQLLIIPLHFFCVSPHKESWKPSQSVEKKKVTKKKKKEKNKDLCDIL